MAISLMEVNADLCYTAFGHRRSQNGFICIESALLNLKGLQRFLKSEVQSVLPKSLQQEFNLSLQEPQKGQLCALKFTHLLFSMSF